MDLNLFIVIAVCAVSVIGVIWVLLQIVADIRWQRNNQPSLIVEKRAKKKQDADLSANAALSLNRVNLTKSEMRLSKAGIPITSRNWNFGQLIIAFLIFFIGTIFGGAFMGFVLALCVPIAAHFYLNAQIKKRDLLFEQQLNAAERQMAENLRSGLTVSRSIKTVSEQTADPLRSELERVYTEMTYSNVSLSEALQNMANRTGQKDVELLATILRVQEETGADLSDSLDYLADTLAKRIEMRGAIKVELSQTKMTIKVVALAPPGILLFTLFFYSGYMEFYSQPLGVMILVAVGLVELVGLYVLNKMSTIKFN